jgi:ribosome-associated heat shock protein Hsp15
VPHYLKNLTPPEEYEVLKMNKASGFLNRAKGLGRPTKKDRREWDDFTGSDVEATDFSGLNYLWEENEE